MVLKATSRRILWKYWYPYLTRLIKDSPLTFLNYGYAELDAQAKPIELLPADEPNRLFIQLYHHVASPINLTGLTVMEVSCGHGGGASYIARYLTPASMLGVDRNANAVDFCRQQRSVKKLSFAQGDAEALKFDNSSFDAIINVEASHCYGNMEQFLKEIARLLKPGGYFLSADFRSKSGQSLLHKQLVQSGLGIVKEENITANVLKAMDANDKEKLELINQLVPGVLHKPFKQFAGVKGSNIYKAFSSGTMVYISYALQKPPI